MKDKIIIREAISEDLDQINEIVNESIKNSFSNWAWSERTIEDAKVWFEEHNSREYCIFVAVMGNIVAGYGSLSTLRKKEGYWPVVENSVYVHKEFRGQRIGKGLMTVLINRAKECNLRAISAWIDSENKESINMHEKFGFYITGELKNIGEKFNVKRSATIMQLDIEQKD